MAVRLRGIEFSQRYEVLALLAFLVSLTVFNGFGLNRARFRRGGLPELGSLLMAWLTVVALLLVFGYLTKTSVAFSRVALMTWVVLAFLSLELMYVVAWSHFSRLRQRGIGVSTAVLGPLSPAARRFAAEVRADSSLGIRLLGYFDDRETGAYTGLPHLGPLRQLSDYVQLERVDAAYLASEGTSEEQLAEVIEALQCDRTCIYMIPNVFTFDLLQSELQSVNGIPVLALGGRSVEWRRLAKRAMDLLLTGPCLLLLAPMFALIAMAIKLDSKGPVIFRQRRYGLYGEEIIVWKFRTMHSLDNDRHRMQQAMRVDPRVTRVGRWLRRTSVDELPQLWNVLCGTMSLVGPRPHAVAHNEFYRDKLRGYMLRHRTRPGMTGWAQINGCRGETHTLEQMQRRLDYDLEYMRRWSPLLDMWILLRTIPALLLNRDVY